MIFHKLLIKKNLFYIFTIYAAINKHLYLKTIPSPLISIKLSIELLSCNYCSHDENHIWQVSQSHVFLLTS